MSSDLRSPGEAVSDPDMAPMRGLQALLLNWMGTRVTLEHASDGLREALQELPPRGDIGIEGGDAGIYTECVRQTFRADPPEVASAYMTFWDFAHTGSRADSMSLRQDLLSDFYSPFSISRDVLSHGQSLRDRLDEQLSEVGATPSHRSLPSGSHASQRGGDDDNDGGDNGINDDQVEDTLRGNEGDPSSPSDHHEASQSPYWPRALRDKGTPSVDSRALDPPQRAQPPQTAGSRRVDVKPTTSSPISQFVAEARDGVYEVTRKDVSRIRRDAKALVNADHVDPYRGIADERLFSVWLGYLHRNARKNGISGDPVALYYYVVASVGDTLLSKVQPCAPGPGSSSPFLKEVVRILRYIERDTAGLSSEVLRWNSEQAFATLRQGSSEGVIHFLDRFESGVIDLESQLNLPIPDDKKLTQLLRGLSPRLRSVAIERLACGDVAASYRGLVQYLTQRDRLSQAIQPTETSGSTDVGKNRGRHPLNVVTNGVSNGGLSQDDGGSSTDRPVEGKQSTGGRRRPICYQWQRKGYCRFGDRCKFRHDGPDASTRSTSDKKGTVSHVQASPVTVESDGSDTDDSSISSEDNINVISHVGGYDGLPFAELVIAGYGSVPALLDSGAYRNYIPSTLVDTLSGSVDFDVRLGGKETAALADGQTIQITGTVVIEGLKFYILESKLDYVILGVDSMRSLGVSLSFLPGSTRMVVLGRGTPSLSQGDDSCENSGLLAHLWSPHALPSTADFCLCDWRPVEDAEGYVWHSRRLREGEVKDTEGQKYCIEVSIPTDREKLASLHGGKDFGAALLERLNPAERLKYDEEVKKYIDRRWWADCGPVKRVHSDDLVCFPVRAKDVSKSTSIRPVLDARSRNRCSPFAGYPGAPIAAILANLRLSWKTGSRVLTRDASAAFYRVRLTEASSVTIVTHQRRYSSSRLVFGLRAGPSCLWAALTWILDCAFTRLTEAERKKINHGYIYLYLDDFTFCWPPDVVDIGLKYVSLVEETAQWFGFELPPHKGHDSNVDKDFKHLGLQWHFTEDGVEVSCVKRALSSTFEVDGTLKERWSVRELYALAGAAGTGSDPCLVHARVRLAGDIIRSLTSGVLSSGAPNEKRRWDASVTFESGSVQFGILKSCYDVISSHVRTTCCHKFFGARRLLVYVDASTIGWGFCIYGQPRVGNKWGSEWLFQEAAGIFKNQQMVHHINRKELWALSRVAICLHALLCPEGQLIVPVEEIVVLCDSQTACRWSVNTRCTSKSVEKVAVRRLAVATQEVIGDLKEAGVRWSLKKVDSSENRADSLSRLGVGLKGLDDADDDIPPLFEPPSSSTSTVVSAVVHRPDLVSSVDVKRLMRIQRESKLYDEVVKVLSKEYNGVISPTVKKALDRKRLRDDGVLLSLTYPHGDLTQSPREVIFIPTDTDDGLAEARRVVDGYHQATHFNARYIKWQVSRDFHIPSLGRIAAEICRRCERCQLSIVSRFFKGAYGPTDARACSVWDEVAIDLCGPFPRDTETGFTSAMVLVCLYSHFTFVCGLKNQGGAAAAEAVDKVCDVVGTMRRLRSDGGSCFTCATFRKMCERRHIRHFVVNRYSPFQNGAAERAVAGVKKMFRLFPEIVAKHGKPSRWFSLLGRSIRRLNDRPFLGSTPFQIFYGRPRNHEEMLRYDGVSVPDAPALADLNEQRRTAQEDFNRQREGRQPDRSYRPRSLRLKPGQLVVIYRSTTKPGHTGGTVKDVVYKVLYQNGVDVCLRPVSDQSIPDLPGEGPRDVVEHVKNLRPYYA